MAAAFGETFGRAARSESKRRGRDGLGGAADVGIFESDGAGGWDFTERVYGLRRYAPGYAELPIDRHIFELIAKDRQRQRLEERRARVIDELEDLIVDGHLQPNERLPLNDGIGAPGGSMPCRTATFNRLRNGLEARSLVFNILLKFDISLEVPMQPRRGASVK